MNTSISADLMSATISQAQSGSRPPPPPGGGDKGGPPDHASAIESLGSSLSDDVKDALFAGVEELEKSGASFEEIKSFVDNELEANGVDVSGGGQRSGQLVDVMS